MTRIPHRLLAAATLAVAITSCATAPDTKGEAPPLVAPDGGDVLLAPMFAAHDATVLVWWSSSCPCVKRYAERVRDLAERFRPRGVAFYYVASNADDGPTEIAAAAPSAALPILQDPGGALADHFAVTSTPTVIVIDHAGAMRFRGWVDNEHPVGDPDREPWLEDALGWLADGGAGTRLTPVWGCMVTKSLGKVGRCHVTPVAPSVTPE